MANKSVLIENFERILYLIAARIVEFLVRGGV